MLEAAHLYYSYHHDDHYAAEDISFNIAPGEILGFLGPSGAGKSTVQKLLTGILPLQRGSALIDGREIKKSHSELFNLIGVSFEQPNVYKKLSGLENLEFHRRMYGVPTADPVKLLHLVGLGSDLHKKAGEYSKGMLQRLVFARSMLNNPRMWFLDEPTAGLDPATVKTIKDIIRAKQEEGVTIFLTTHNMFLADEICDNIAFLNEGQILAMDTPKKLKLKYGSYSVNVEYRKDKKILTELFFLDKDEEKNEFEEGTV